MKIGTMLNDVLKSFFAKSATQLYPAERTEPPKRYRGALDYDPKLCTGCSLCAKDCPSEAISMVVNDKQTKSFVLRYQVDRCIFCAQCTENCRFNCLTLSNTEWELAALTREPFLYY